MCKSNNYLGDIKALKENEVFVIGTNASGFHGAGSAGFSSFNEPGNVWRKYDYDSWPNGTKGKWNIKGTARGLMQGAVGKSYGIQTVTRPGAKRSVSLDEIKEQIDTFKIFAESNPELIFYVSFGSGGLNGYSAEEMASACSGDWPDNVLFKEELTKYF